MIGVLVSDSRVRLVGELFELFKTPWETYHAGSRYDAVLCFGCAAPEGAHPFTGVYSASPVQSDETQGFRVSGRRRQCQIDAGERAAVLPAAVATVAGAGDPVLHSADNGGVLARRVRSDTGVSCRFGFDLLEQMEWWLSHGQRPAAAMSPALDLQVALLRELLIDAGVPLIEVLPTPEAHTFCACLTHDVDFMGIRFHVFDRTFFGFLYRATVGSLVGIARRRLSVTAAFRNIRAVLSLPLIYLGFLPDFMNCLDRYEEIDGSEASTFFVIPFKDRNGEKAPDKATARRRVKYDVDDVRPQLDALRSRGVEIAVHGIDAWHSVEAGRTERRRIDDGSRADSPAGIRMHWLWSSSDTPEILEKAGYRYDSTFGYNGAVGFRGATTQPFRPLPCSYLLELPLAVQDTALFFPDRMNLTETGAWPVAERLVDTAVRFGGMLVFNWHQRSLAPERNWGDFYRRLVRHLRRSGAWLTTASRAAKWFAARRSLSFVEELSNGQRRIRIIGRWPYDMPPPSISVYGTVGLKLELNEDATVELAQSP